MVGLVLTVNPRAIPSRGERPRSFTSPPRPDVPRRNRPMNPSECLLSHHEPTNWYEPLGLGLDLRHAELSDAGGCTILGGGVLRRRFFYRSTHTARSRRFNAAPGDRWPRISSVIRTAICLNAAAPAPMLAHECGMVSGFCQPNQASLKNAKGPRHCPGHPHRERAYIRLSSLKSSLQPTRRRISTRLYDDV